MVAILGVWVYHNLFPIEPMEYRLVEQHFFSWLIAPVVARLFIGLQIVVAFLLLANINPKNRTVKLLFLILLASLPDLWWEISGKVMIMDHCYGCITGDFDGLNGLLWIGLLICGWWLLRSEGHDWKFKWIKYPVAIAGLALPFILNPIFPEDFQDTEPIISEPLESNLVPDSLANQPFILAVFHPGCKYCARMAQKISVAKEVAPSFPPVLVFMRGKQEYIDHFFEVTRTRLNYTVIDRDIFLRLTQGSYPKVYYVKDNQLIKRWKGRGLNYRVANLLSQPGFHY